jgi:hypothetical protein
VEESISAEADEAEVSETDVFVTGTLVLSNLTGDGLYLSDSNAGGSYALNCVTFDSQPSASNISVTSINSGKFSFGKTLSGFAGVSFGCFLLEDENILSPIVFSGRTSILAGAGKIDFDLSYNGSSGSAAAIVNETTSTALAPEKVNSAIEAKGATRTDMSAFGGTYSFSCEQEDGLPCREDDIPDQVYFSSFTNVATQHVAVWESKEKRDLCMINGGTEKEPSFYMQIGSSCLTMQFEDTDTLNSSLNNAYEVLATSDAGSIQKELADTIYTSSVQYSSYRDDMCNLVADQSNCKLVLGEVESYTYEDYYTKEQVTYTYPKWYDTDTILNSLTSYTGTVTTKQITCSTHWQPNVDIQPQMLIGAGQLVLRQLLKVTTLMVMTEQHYLLMHGSVFRQTKQLLLAKQLLIPQL